MDCSQDIIKKNWNRLADMAQDGIDSNNINTEDWMVNQDDYRSIVYADTCVREIPLLKKIIDENYVDLSKRTEEVIVLRKEKTELLNSIKELVNSIPHETIFKIANNIDNAIKTIIKSENNWRPL